MHQPYPTTILQVLPAFDHGGVERVTLDTALGLGKKPGVLVLVASHGGKLTRELGNTSAHITLPLRSKNPLRIFLNAFALRSVLRAHRVDLVHVRSRAPAHSVRLACWMTGVPFVGTCHGAYGTENKLKRWYNAALMRGRAVIAISAFVEHYINTYYTPYNPAITVIYEGIDTTLFDPTRYTSAEILKTRAEWHVQHGEIAVLLPSRIARGKGHFVALEALQKCAHLPFKLIFLGSTQGKKNYPDTLKTHVQNDPLLAERVTFVENAVDIPLAYAASDVVLSIGTKPEAFGRVAVEAGAMERVVIGANHGATPELIDDPRWLISPGSADDLAEKLQQFAALSETQKKEITVSARRRVVEHFSLEAMLTQTWSLYTSLIKTHGLPHRCSARDDGSSF